MNKKVISRLDKLIEQAKSLPEHLYTQSEFEDYSSASTDEERGSITKIQYDRKQLRNELFRKILPFFNAHIPEKKEYFNQLHSLTFEPKGVVVNSFHYKNDESWRNDRRQLIQLLEILKDEFEESKYAVKDKDSIFKSRLFWTIVSTVSGLAFFLATYTSGIYSGKLQDKIEELQTKQQLLKENNTKLTDSLKIIGQEGETTKTK